MAYGVTRGRLGRQSRLVGLNGAAISAAHITGCY